MHPPCDTYGYIFETGVATLPLHPFPLSSQMSQEVKADWEKHQHAASCDCSVENHDTEVILFARTSTHRPHSKLWRLIIDSCVVMKKEYLNIFECDWDKIPAEYLDLAKDLDHVLRNPDVGHGGHDLERFRCLRAS